MRFFEIVVDVITSLGQSVRRCNGGRSRDNARRRYRNCAKGDNANPITHISVTFNNAAGSETMRTYALDAATLRLAQIWTAAKPQPPAGEEFAEWLDEHGGKLDRAGGPADVETRADGYRCEEWWRRANSTALTGRPSSKSAPDGSRREAWYKQGQRDRADGPAIVESRADGSRRSSQYKCHAALKT